MSGVPVLVTTSSNVTVTVTFSPTPKVPSAVDADTLDIVGAVAVTHSMTS